MAAGTEPKSRPGARPGSEGATLVWLDSLAAGLCTTEAFVVAMRERYQDGDGNWEVLSLLDQYYRRGKLKPEIFQAVKSRIENLALHTDISPPVLRSAASAVTAPIAAAPSMNAAAMPPSATSQPTALPRMPRSRAAAREVAAGDVLRGRYRIARALGFGGTGTVFEAQDGHRIDEPFAGKGIALKALHPAVVQSGELLFEVQRRFQLLQSLSHPNIVRVHEFDRDGDSVFFTMELLCGELLGRVLSARGEVPLPRPQALAAIRDIGAALSHAHSRGVVHGEVNPQNIFITNEGDLRVLGFGAAHGSAHDLPSEAELPQRAPGSPGYSSCELLEGQRPDARDDVFALACVAYVLLSGRLPFAGRTALEARTRRVGPGRPPGLTGSQWRVLQEGLRLDRDRRPSDVHDWLKRFDLRDAAPHLPALQTLIKVPAPRSPKALIAAAGVVLIALLAAGGFWVATNYDSLARQVAEWRASGASDHSAPVSSETPASNEAPVSAPAATQPPTPTETALSTPASTPSAPPPSEDAPTPSAPSSSGDAPTVRAPTPSGAQRLEMAADAVDVPAVDRSAHVTVRRKGNSQGAANFTWWTESGTAKPGLDFVPVLPHGERMGDGQSSANLAISLPDAPRNRAKSFYVVIDQAESGPAMGARTVTMVTLQPPD